MSVCCCNTWNKIIPTNTYTIISKILCGWRWVRFFNCTCTSISSVFTCRLFKPQETFFATCNLGFSWIDKKISYRIGGETLTFLRYSSKLRSTPYCIIHFYFGSVQFSVKRKLAVSVQRKFRLCEKLKKTKLRARPAVGHGSDWPNRNRLLRRVCICRLVQNLGRDLI